jgi:hypothetical protein
MPADEIIGNWEATPDARHPARGLASATARRAVTHDSEIAHGEVAG